LRDQSKAPIAFNRRMNGYYYTVPSFQLPYFDVTEGECVALFLAERLLQQYRGAPFAADIARLFQKIVDLLSQPITVNLQHLSDSTSFRQRSAGVGDVKRFEQLRRAAHEGRQLDIDYWTASRNETNRRVVDPYHLASVDGDWFLVAYCHLREEVRSFSP